MTGAVFGDVAFAFGTVMANAAEVAKKFARGDGPFLLRKCRTVFLYRGVEIELAALQSGGAAVAVMGFEIEPKRKSVKEVAGE